MIEGVATLDGIGILYRSVLLPLSEDSVAIDHLVGAATRLDPSSEFPLVLTSAKTPIYCHSQHRNLSRLRRVIPDPVVELNPATAALHQIEQNEWVSISTARGSVRARAHLNASLADGVIGGQHGWWQSCPDLGLPGYDPTLAIR